MNFKLQLIDNFILRNNIKEINKILEKKEHEISLLLWERSIVLGNLIVFKLCIDFGKIPISSNLTTAILIAAENGHSNIVIEFLTNADYIFIPSLFYKIINKDNISLLNDIYNNHSAFNFLDLQTQNAIKIIILNYKLNKF